MNIDSIIDNWDLIDSKKEEKRAILNDWISKIDSESDQNILLTICNNINYYSEKKTVDTLDSIINSDQEENKKTIYFPVRKHNRVESSVPIFCSYLVNSGIRDTSAQNLILEKTRHYLKNLFEELSYLDYLRIKHHETNDPIQKKEYEDHINELMRNKEYPYPYYNLANIALIDDFVGSGTSLVQFIQGSLIPSFQYLRTPRKLHITFYVFEASKDGERHVLDYIKENPLIPNNVTISLKKGTTAIDFLANQNIYSNLNDVNLNDVKKLVDNINNAYRFKINRFSKNMAVASFVNAPNNNLPFVSNTNTEKGWFPLFRRVTVAGTKNVNDDIDDFINNLEDSIIDSMKGFDNYG